MTDERRAYLEGKWREAAQLQEEAEEAGRLVDGEKMVKRALLPERARLATEDLPVPVTQPARGMPQARPRTTLR